MAIICLITSGQRSTNPRLVKEADALTEDGHRVFVICTRLATWATNADQEFVGRKWSVVACIPLGPFERPAMRFYRGVRRRIARIVFSFGILRSMRVAEAAWHDATPDLVRAAKRVKADLYIAHYPAALPAAARAARLFGVPYAYDAEDFHLGDCPEAPEFELERRMTRCLEGTYLAGASYVTAASPGIADAYVTAYDISRPTVVLNVFSRCAAPAVASTIGHVRPGPSLYWFSQTVGQDRGIECAIRAVGAAASKPHLYLRGRCSAEFGESLKDLAARCGASERIHLLAPENPSSMERLASAYDIGLALETGHTVNRRIALTNKIFTFLLAGIPVLLSDIPAHQQFAMEAGRACQLFTAEDPSSLAEAMDGMLLCSANEIAATRRAAWELGQDRFNWDVEKKQFLNRVNTALNARVNVG